MKKIILAAVLFAVTATMATALDITVGAKGTLAINAGTKFEGWTEVGVKSLKLIPGVSVKEKTNVGGGGEIFARVNFLELPVGKLGAQAGLGIIANNGRTVEASAGSQKGKIKYSYTSLDIPLMVTYEIPVWLLKIIPMAGLNFSIPLGKGKAKTYDDLKGYFNGEGSVEFDIKSRFIPGLVFGAGATFDLGPGAILFDARYLIDFGKFKVDASKIGGASEDEALSRKSLDFSLGYQISF